MENIINFVIMEKNEFWKLKSSFFAVVLALVRSSCQRQGCGGKSMAHTRRIALWCGTLDKIRAEKNKRIYD